MIKNLVVADIAIPYELIKVNSTSVEKAIIRDCVICKEEKNGYIDLETNKYYHKFNENNKVGNERILPDSIIPLTEYYNFLGMKKNNNHENKNKVYSKVDKLKKMGKI